MTDTDLEIDPALDAHLRRTLHAVAASVVDAETASDNVIRLVTAPAPSAPRHRWAWLGAAAAAGVVAGAGLMAVADRDTDQADVPAASTTPVVEADPTLVALAQACAADIAQQMATFPYETRESSPALPSADAATVLLFDTQAEPPHQQLLVIGETSYIVCEVARNSALEADVNVYPLPALAPDNDGVLVTDRTSWTGADPLHGPGWVLDEQAAILADGAVSADEYDAALRRFADCVNATPFDITVTVLGGGVVSFSSSDLNSDSPQWDEQNSAQALCSAAHLDLVDEARSLLDAQRRVAEG